MASVTAYGYEENCLKLPAQPLSAVFYGD